MIRCLVFFTILKQKTFIITQEGTKLTKDLLFDYNQLSAYYFYTFPAGCNQIETLHSNAFKCIIS